jgi:hypothetical protein
MLASGFTLRVLVKRLLPGVGALFLDLELIRGDAARVSDGKTPPHRAEWLVVSLRGQQFAPVFVGTERARVNYTPLLTRCFVGDRSASPGTTVVYDRRKEGGGWSRGLKTA